MADEPKEIIEVDPSAPAPEPDPEPDAEPTEPGIGPDAEGAPEPEPAKPAEPARPAAPAKPLPEPLRAFRGMPEEDQAGCAAFAYNTRAACEAVKRDPRLKKDPDFLARCPKVLVETWADEATPPPASKELTEAEVIAEARKMRAAGREEEATAFIVRHEAKKPLSEIEKLRAEIAESQKRLEAAQKQEREQREAERGEQARGKVVDEMRDLAARFPSLVEMTENGAVYKDEEFKDVFLGLAHLKKYETTPLLDVARKALKTMGRVVKRAPRRETEAEPSRAAPALKPKADKPGRRGEVSFEYEEHDGKK